MTGRIYTDTGGTLRALWGEDAARINALTNVHAGAKIPWTQASAAARPKVARMPVTGVRNLANAAQSTSGYENGVTINGITTTVLGSGFDGNGVGYVDIRLNGTASAAETRGIYLAANSTVSGVQIGDTFTGKAIIRRIGGSTANTIGLRVLLRQLGGATNQGGSFVTGESDTVSEASLTATTTDNVDCVLQLVVTNGQPVDISFRVTGLQLERGDTATDPQNNLSVYDITETGVNSIACVEVDGLVDQMGMVIPDGITDGRVAYCSPEKGIWIEEGVTVAPGGTLNWGATTGAGGTVGLIEALGRRFWAVIPLDGTRASDDDILNAEARKLGLPGVITTLPS